MQMGTCITCQKNQSSFQANALVSNFQVGNKFPIYLQTTYNEIHAHWFIYMLSFKYFVIIKKEEIVAPWIDFDDYKAFEGVLMIFAWKRLIALQGQNHNFTKTLIWKHQMIEQKICDPLMKILLFLDLYFERYACLKIMSRPMSQLMAQWAVWHAYFLAWHNLWVDPWVDPQGMSRPMSRPLLFLGQKSQNLVFWLFSVVLHRGRPMSRPPGMSRPMSRPLWRNFSATASF